MPKPTKTDLKRYREVLQKHLSLLKGDVGSMRDEALRASEQDSSVDHMADQGTDNYDQGFLLGLIENEELTIQLIEEALDRLEGKGDFPFGACARCHELAEEEKAGGKKGKKSEPWIVKERLNYIPWTRHCVVHQEEMERNRESA